MHIRGEYYAENAYRLASYHYLLPFEFLIAYILSHVQRSLEYGREGKVLKDIVQKVLQKIPTRNRYLPSHLVGIDDHVENMMAFLNRHPSGEQFFLIRGKRGNGTIFLNPWKMWQ